MVKKMYLFYQHTITVGEILASRADRFPALWFSETIQNSATGSSIIISKIHTGYQIRKAGKNVVTLGCLSHKNSKILHDDCHRLKLYVQNGRCVHRLLGLVSYIDDNPPKGKSVCSSSRGVVRKKISSLWMHATCILEIIQGVWLILCACFRVRVQKLFLSSRPLPVRQSAVAF